MKLTEISLRRPITIVMLFISLAAFGVLVWLDRRHRLGPRSRALALGAKE